MNVQHAIDGLSHSMLDVRKAIRELDHSNAIEGLQASKQMTQEVLNFTISKVQDLARRHINHHEVSIATINSKAERVLGNIDTVIGYFNSITKADSHAVRSMALLIRAASRVETIKQSLAA